MLLSCLLHDFTPLGHMCSHGLIALAFYLDFGNPFYCLSGLRLVSVRIPVLLTCCHVLLFTCVFFSSDAIKPGCLGLLP